MKFRKCLDDLNNDYEDEGDEESLVTIEDFAAGTNIANLYFRHITQCFLFENPWTCLRNDTTFKDDGDIRCRVYILNKTQPEKFRYFQLPFALDDGGKRMDTVHENRKKPTLLVTAYALLMRLACFTRSVANVNMNKRERTFRLTNQF